MSQQLLVMLTDGCRPTSKATDAKVYQPPALVEPSDLASPLEVIAAGWRLMAPATMVVAEVWEWWFEKEASRGE